MKRLLVLSSIILTLLVIGALIRIFVFPTPAPEAIPVNNPFTFATGTPVAVGETVSLTLKDGTSAAVQPFIVSGQPEWASDTNGYQVTTDEETTYSILYYPNTTGFLVSLLAEPLGASRLAAEKELKAKLGLSTTQICELQVQVFTSISVNETYAGQDLGLSFCPGAVKLPQ